MKLRNTTNCDECCKGKRISELDEKVDIQGTEYIPYLEGDDNGKFSLGSLKDYLIKLIEEYLINNGIIREDWVQSEPAYKLLATLPELIADRACKDEFGNNINDTYLTREAVKEYIGSIYEDLFVNNPPQILDGFITVDMLSDAVLQLLNSGGAITNFPDDEDITVKDGKLKFKDKVYDPNNYSGMGRTILRKNMVDGVNVLTQEMMSEPNVIYVIQYDYDLRGETIVVPDNSILWYLGGSLNNGHITSDDEDRLIIWGNLNGDIEIDIDVSLVGAPADEEDITTESGVLKFKDKEYDTASFSGLGRKYLRKNIVKGKNILTQEMINSANTRYIIQYDYDLNEETITIPEGCVLQFEGGSLSNGTVVGTNTKIVTNSDRIFESNIDINGNWNIISSYPEWFGAKGDGTTDDYESINKAISLSKKVIFSSNKTYITSKPLIVKSGKSLEGNRCTIIKNTDTISDYGDVVIGDNDNEIINCDVNAVIIVPGKWQSVYIRDFTIQNNGGSGSYGIFFTSIFNSNIENLYIYNCDIGIFIASIITSIFSHVEVDRANLYGVRISSERKDNTKGSCGTSATFLDCFISSAKQAAYKIDSLGYSSIIGGAAEGSQVCLDAGGSNLFVSSLGMEHTPGKYLSTYSSTVTMINCYGDDLGEQTGTYYEHFTGVNSKINIINGFFKCDTHPYLCYLENGCIIKFDNVYLDSYNTQSYPSKKIRWGGSIYNTVKFEGNGGQSTIYGKSDDDSTLGSLPDASFIYKGTNVLNSSTPLWSIGSDFVDCFGKPRNYKPEDSNTISYKGSYFNNSNSINNCPTSYGTLFYNSDAAKNTIYVSTSIPFYNRIFHKTTIAGEINDWRMIMFQLSGTSSDRDNLDNNVIGDIFYDTDLNIPCWWNGTKWVDSNGFSPNIKKGTTEQRPLLTSSDDGFEYYDSTLKKKILWNGTAWVNMDGTALE